MTVDIYSWITEHYSPWTEVHPRTHKHGDFVCRRCGMHVWHVTKHAVNVHGDPIDVMPAVRPGESDHEGRRVAAVGP